MASSRFDTRNKFNKILISLSKNISTRTYQALKKFSNAVIADAARNLKRSKRVASGKLLNSLTYKIVKLKKSIRVSLGAPAKSPFNGFQYGQTIENGIIGTNPKPSSQEVEIWMKSKGIKPVWRERDSKGRFKAVPIERKYKNVSYWIARKIAKNGFDNVPDRYLEDAIEKNLYILNERLNNVFG